MNLTDLNRSYFNAAFARRCRGDFHHRFAGELSPPRFVELLEAGRLAVSGWMFTRMKGVGGAFAPAIGGRPGTQGQVEDGAVRQVPS